MPGGLHPPLSIIESWPAPDYAVKASDHGDVAALITVWALSMLMVAARLVARYLGRSFGLDDILMVASIFPTTGLVASCCLSISKYGFGTHIWDLPTETLIEGRRITFANEFLYVWATGLVKLSILCFHRRLAVGTVSGRFVLVVRCCTATVIAYMIALNFSLIFTCRPFNSFWNQVTLYLLAPDSYYCTREDIILMVSTACSVCHDCLVTILPFTLFWNLQKLPLRQKVALGSIFAIGFLVCAVGIYRCFLIYRIFWETYDVTWYSRDIWIWTVLEVLLGTMCASAPALKMFYNLIFRGCSDATSTTSGAQSSRLSRFVSRPSKFGSLPFNNKNDIDKNDKDDPSASPLRRLNSKPSDFFAGYGFYEATVSSNIDKKDDLINTASEMYEMSEYTPIGIERSSSTRLQGNERRVSWHIRS